MEIENKNTILFWYFTISLTSIMIKRQVFGYKSIRPIKSIKWMSRDIKISIMCLFAVPAAFIQYE